MPKVVDLSSRETLQRRLGAMKVERESFMAHWQELSQFVEPRRGRFLITDVNKGTKCHQSIINSTATKALQVAQSGMLAGIMSPSRPWFQLGPPDPEMNEYKPVKIWLWQVTHLMLDIFNQSNLYMMAPTMLGNLLLHATGFMTHEDDFDDVARFYTHPTGSYMLAQDDRNKVTTFAREFYETVEQVVAKFGYGNCSTWVQGMYDRGNYDTWAQVAHFVSPSELYTPNTVGSKKYRSCYFEPTNQDKTKFLEQKGFNAFPGYAPRWEVTGNDIYGTNCPGMIALGDTKQLQIEEKRKAQGIDKLVNPPLQGPPSLRGVPVSALPGGLTIYQQQDKTIGLRPIYEVKPDLGALTADIRGVEQRIKEIFFTDLFLAITSMEGIQPRNEFELNQRNQERLLQLGPVLEQTHGGFLSQLIDRTFDQIIAAKLVPPAPPELQGKPLRVKYISSLAIAMRATMTGGIDRLGAFIGGLMKAGLSDGKKFDGDQAVDEYGEAIGSPPKIIRSDDEVAEMRQQEQQRLAMQQGVEMAGTAAKAAKDAAQAQTATPSVLSNLAAAMGQRGAQPSAAPPSGLSPMSLPSAGAPVLPARRQL